MKHKNTTNYDHFDREKSLKEQQQKKSDPELSTKNSPDNIGTNSVLDGKLSMDSPNTGFSRGGNVSGN